MKYGTMPVQLAVLSLGSINLHAKEKPEKSQRPNIIWIMSDDHSCQAISAYGHPVSKLAPTPHIDRIAKTGVVFDCAFVENSISTPSRATLLTGMYSKNHGQTHFGYGLDPAKAFYSEYLQGAGYRTAVFGKWHVNAEPKGFDYYDIFMDQGEYYNPEFRNPQTNGQYIREKGYATTLVTDHAVRWMDEVKGNEDKPFCLVLLHKAPHRNWMPDLSHLYDYEDVEFPEPETLFDDHATRGGQMKTHELSIGDHLGYAFDFKVEALKDEPTLQYIKESWPLAMDRLDKDQRAQWDKVYTKIHADFLTNRPVGKDLVRWKYQRYMKDYCKTVKSIDEQVGRVLDYLKANELEENTVVVYTSDQGFFMGEHGLYDKRFIYEESLRTPFLITWPGKVKGGRRSDKLIQNIDFAPTILDLAGIATPPDMDGVSIMPILENKKNIKWRDAVYYEFYDYPAVGLVRPHYGIRTDRYKLVHWYSKGEGEEKGVDFDHWELYDLKNDPNEVNNVYNIKEYKETQKDLHERLDKLRDNL